MMNSRKQVLLEEVLLEVSLQSIKDKLLDLKSRARKVTVGYIKTKSVELVKKLMHALRREGKETKEAGKIILKALLGKRPSAAEIKFVKAQSGDVLKVIAIAITTIIPVPIVPKVVYFGISKIFKFDPFPKARMKTLGGGE